MPEFEPTHDSLDFLHKKLPSAPADVKASLVYQCGVASAESRLRKLKTQNRWFTGAFAITSFVLGLAIAAYPTGHKTDLAASPQPPSHQPTTATAPATTSEQELWMTLRPKPRTPSHGNTLSITDRDFDQVFAVQENKRRLPQTKTKPTTIGSFLREHL